MSDETHVEAWAEMARRTGAPFGDVGGGAYASDMFEDWPGCVSLLRDRGFSVEQAERFLRSKHMRWCSDGSSKGYGHTTAADLAAYLDRLQPAPDDETLGPLVARMAEEAAGKYIAAHGWPSRDRAAAWLAEALRRKGMP